MEFTVKPKSLRAAGSNMKGVGGNINRAARIISNASKNLDSSMASYAVVAGKLRTYTDSVENLGSKTIQMGRAAVSISYLYENADNETADRENLISKVVWGGIGGAGPIGSTIDAANSLGEGDYRKAIQDILGACGDIAEKTEDGKTDWKKALKLDKIVPDDVLDEYGTPGNYGVGKVKEGLSSKTAWALAILENAWDNYMEHGGFTARFFEELGIESAIDVAEGALLIAGVGALAVAAGVTAPAWAVAAAAAAAGIVVDAGLDWVVSKITGNPDASWKESVSDFICDLGEKITGGKHKRKSRVKWGKFNLGTGGAW